MHEHRLVRLVCETRLLPMASWAAHGACERDTTQAARRRSVSTRSAPRHDVATCGLRPRDSAARDAGASLRLFGHWRHWPRPLAVTSCEPAKLATLTRRERAADNSRHTVEDRSRHAERLGGVRVDVQRWLSAAPRISATCVRSSASTRHRAAARRAVRSRVRVRPRTCPLLAYGWLALEVGQS
jgi:hypothetical protein